jgi:methionyl-tRNA formyltransferase
MKIVFFGTPDFVIPVIESLLTHHDVIAVVTAPDHVDTRKNKFVPSPIKSYYQHYYETHTDLNHRYPLQVFTPEKLSMFNAQLSTLQPDLFVVAAYGKIIPESILDIPPLGAINIHPSLLPKYRGTAPVQNAILHGDTTTGVSIIKMDEKMDHGPILASESESIFDTDTFDSLVRRLFEKAALMLPEVIKNYTAGNIPLEPQDEREATYTKIITKEDGYIDLTNIKPDDIRKIRAYYPWPAAWTTVQVKNQELRIKFLPATSLQSNLASNTSISPTTLFLLQPEGKKPMTIKDFLNGYPEVKDTIKKLIPGD